ncbi:hypothetical protein L9F63_011072, partial [Diploptera punctata]
NENINQKLPQLEKKKSCKDYNKDALQYRRPIVTIKKLTVVKTADDDFLSLIQKLWM